MANSTVPPVEPAVDFSHFTGLDVRAATVLEALPFPEARKPAYKLRLDLGPLGQRWSSAQITDLYEPEGLIGTQVLAVVNLGSRRIAGFKSECLVLGVPDANGAVVLVRPDRVVENGVRLY